MSIERSQPREKTSDSFDLGEAVAMKFDMRFTNPYGENFGPVSSEQDFLQIPAGASTVDGYVETEQGSFGIQARIHEAQKIIKDIKSYAAACRKVGNIETAIKSAHAEHERMAEQYRRSADGAEEAILAAIRKKNDLYSELDIIKRQRDQLETRLKPYKM